MANAHREMFFTTEGWAGDYIMRILSEYQQNLDNHDISEYTDALNDFAIIPECVDENLQKVWKERTRVSLTRRTADIRLWIRLDEFSAADKEGKRQLVIDNVARAARVLAQKAKGRFDLEGFLRDALGEDFARVNPEGGR